MTTKELNKAIKSFFEKHKSKDCVTYESLIELFEKQPTVAQSKNISNSYKNTKLVYIPQVNMPRN